MERMGNENENGLGGEADSDELAEDLNFYTESGQDLIDLRDLLYGGENITSEDSLTDSDIDMISRRLIAARQEVRSAEMEPVTSTPIESLNDELPALPNSDDESNANNNNNATQPINYMLTPSERI